MSVIFIAIIIILIVILIHWLYSLLIYKNSDARIANIITMKENVITPPVGNDVLKVKIISNDGKTIVVDVIISDGETKKEKSRTNKTYPICDVCDFSCVCL